MLNIESIEQQITLCDKLGKKPQPAPPMVRHVTEEERLADPENFVQVGGSAAYAVRCKGWSRQAGRRCRRAATTGRDWCKFHGGHNKGPTTREGLARCATRLVHGNETRQKRRDRKAGHARMRVLSRAVDELLKVERKMRSR